MPKVKRRKTSQGPAATLFLGVSDRRLMDFPRVYSILHQVVHVIIRKYLLFFGFETVRVDAAQVRCAYPLSAGANAAISME